MLSKISYRTTHYDYFFCEFQFLKNNYIFFYRTKYFRGKKIFGDWDIRVEQVSIYFKLSLGGSHITLSSAHSIARLMEGCSPVANSLR